MSSTPQSDAPRTIMAPGARLVIQQGRETQTVALGAQPLAMGRRTDNDIVVSSPYVSGYHARIEPTGAGHRIIDLDSTNGLLFEGRYITDRTFGNGDTLRIGDPVTGNFVTLIYQNEQVGSTIQQRQRAEQYALRADQAQITIGRSGSDIVLDNPQVSRRHARLDRQANGEHMIIDLGSTNGTFVNGQRIQQHPLKHNDIVQMGPFKLVYRGTSLETSDQRGEMHIDARNLTLTVGSGDAAKRILKDISVSIAPREFVALVGGSGAGKSTLLKALSGYVPASNGLVFINGDDYYRNFDLYRTILGYLPQDDIIHRALPVQRTLSYAARLRLPTDTEPQEVKRRIDHVLSSVEMENHRTTVVQRLSGGQRKRTSMAVELLAEPSLFFLDEATSGLDPGLEKKTMYLLRRLADSGCTVVLVTHATENIVQCDHVAFMASGHLVYFGPPTAALTFFGVSSNDFADIYTKLEGRATPDSPLLKNDLRTVYERWRAVNLNAEQPPLLAELWEEKYKTEGANGAPPLYQTYVTRRQLETTDTAAGADNQAGETTSPLQQFWVLARRYIDLLRQDRVNLLVMLVQVPLIALVLLLLSNSAVLLSGTNGIVEPHLVQRNEAKTVLFMVVVATIWFGIFNAAREIAKELPIFVRERLVGLSISAYLGSKVVVLFGIALLQSIVLVAILAVGLSFPDNTGVLVPSLPLLELFVTVVLTAFASTSLGLFVSAMAGKPGRVLSIVPLVLILQIVFAGLIFKIEGLTTGLSWLTVSRWAMDGLGTSVRLLALCPQPNLQNDQGVPVLPCNPAEAAREPDAFLPAAFVHEPSHLLLVWGILLLFTLVSVGLTAWRLARGNWRI